MIRVAGSGSRHDSTGGKTMDALTILGALGALALLLTVLWRWRRSRSDQRRQWLGTRERDWSADELDLLRSSDVAA